MQKARRFDDQITVSDQIAPGDVATLRERGVALVINNRPDDEDAGQPKASEIEEACGAAGIAYRFVPILRGLGPGEVKDMQEAIAAAGGKPVLAFCRSGQRSALVSALARRRSGASREEIEQRLNDVGVDPTHIAHLI